jgi:OFA family oxalate/formate antiporter-like MFS transporter
MLITWALYFCGVFGGLMTIAHAAPLLQSKFPGTTLSSLAVMLVALGNIAGSIGGGLWAQYASPRHALALPVMIGIVAMALLLLAHNQPLALAALAAVGIAYGGLIAAIPVVILTCVGPQGFAYAFGRIFSAWGLAGLVGPPLAGLLFDYSGTYNSALLAALSMSLAALILALLVLPGRRSALQYK